MRLSIALGTFNGVRWLPRQLRSLLAQARLPDEVVAFDDASTDGTAELLRSFAAASPFPVRVEARARNVGVTANFEGAIAACGGDVIFPCDQDDVWYPEKLAAFEAAFARPDPPDLVFSDADVVDESLRPLGHRLWEAVGFGPAARRGAEAGRLLDALLRFNVVTGAAMAVRAARRGLILPVPGSWLHDGWSALLLAAAGRCALIPRPLMAYRQHAGQAIGGRRLALAEQVARARAMDGGYFDRLAENFGAAARRLREHGCGGGAAAAAVDRIEAKAAHCRVRAGLRGPGARPGAAAAAVTVVREWARGHYGAYGLGWRAAAQDLFLAGPAERAAAPRRLVYTQ